MYLIKKRTLLAIFLTVLVGCGDGSSISTSSSTPNNTSSSSDSVSSTTPVIFTENLNKGLPDEWVTEYDVIKKKLISFLPLHQTNYSEIFVYAWNSNIADPYPGVEGGAYISNGAEENTLHFVMEIPNAEFIDSQLHRYSVIVHEYFHCYQKALNIHMNKSDSDPTSFKTKWLAEGSAAVVEGIYIKQNYAHDYITIDQNSVGSEVTTSPQLYEEYNTSKDIDTNYSSSVFLVLVLAKELQALGHTETKAFQLILRDYFTASPNKLTWKTKFFETFGMTVDDFYVKVNNYAGKNNTDVSPTDGLLLEQVFSK